MKIWAELGVWVGVVAGAGWAGAQQTVTVTTTAEFKRGNNEGLVSAAQDQLTRNQISAGTVGNWASTTALPSARFWHTSVVHNGFLYVAGGVDAGFNVLDEVLVAPLNANGSVGAWSDTTPLPSGRAVHSMVAYNGFLFAIGGGDANFESSNDVLVASINADGSIETWIPTTPLPTGRFSPSAVAYNGFLYCIGGLFSDNGGLSDVLVAPIRADGSIGTWASASSLPTVRGYHSAFAHNGHLYAIGGYDSSVLSDSLVAPINANGSLGPWVSTTALPFARSEHSFVAHDGFLYILGGYDANNVALSDVISTALNADGSLGSWSACTDLPSARSEQRSVAYNGFVYTLGGGDDAFTPLDDVIVASIDPDILDANQAPARLRGVYSHLVDLQSDTSTRWLFINGQASPGGAVRAQIRVAPEATAVFGAETIVDDVSLGSPIQISGNGRYVWLRLTLDDTGTSNVDQPTFITDIVISSIDPPTAGLVFDGAGADIDTQTSKTTLGANWSGFAASPGDSLAYYEWAIGTAPGLSNVQGWVNVGLALNASNSSLNLTPGTKFVSVRATATSGLKSNVASSDGVQIPGSGATPGGGGGDDDSKGRCGMSAGASGSFGAAALGALVLAAGLLGRRRARR